MTTIDPSIYYIIGMSPGNSYFKDQEIEYLLKTLVEQHGRAAVLIADIPAISTYTALGYPENRARRDKAIPKGNALKNRVRQVMSRLGYSGDMVRIIDWEKEVEISLDYQTCYVRILHLYQNNLGFEEAANAATRSVLETVSDRITDMDTATKKAVHYLLSEIAFLEFSPTFFKCDKVAYVYHKNWPVFENYISGRFDDVAKPYLNFLLLVGK